MKVLLIQPPYSSTTINVAKGCTNPLALEYIASGIIDSHEVVIYDMRFDKELVVLLNDFDPDIVGITSFTMNVNAVKDILKGKTYFVPEPSLVLGADCSLLVVGSNEDVKRFKDFQG